MRKKVWILAAALCFELCMMALPPEELTTVWAKEPSAEQAAKLTEAKGPVSRGNMIYQDGGKKAGIYGADFSLLWEKLSTISGEVFDPVFYTHTHQWEYVDVDESTHTRHCVICGNAFDLAQVHKAESEEKCTISCEGNEFSGRRYRCVCGYQWERETTHTLTFDTVDETCHRSRCLLDGTEYCQGYEPAEEEHYAYYRTPDQTGRYYIKTCIDCGYQVEEAFESEELPEISEEEPGTPEPDEPSEIIEEETEIPETEKIPEISVSGNDCPVEQDQNGLDEIMKETTDEGGEKL